jgi:hypothetical protein
MLSALGETEAAVQEVQGYFEDTAQLHAKEDSYP